MKTMKRIQFTDDLVSPWARPKNLFASLSIGIAVLMPATQATADVSYGKEMTLMQSCQREGGTWTGTSCRHHYSEDGEIHSNNDGNAVATGIGLLILGGLICAVTDCLAEK
jgi:hypothetical protein